MRAVIPITPSNCPAIENQSKKANLNVFTAEYTDRVPRAGDLRNILSRNFAQQQVIGWPLGLLSVVSRSLYGFKHINRALVWRLVFSSVFHLEYSK